MRILLAGIDKTETWFEQERFGYVKCNTRNPSITLRILAEVIRDYI